MPSQRQKSATLRAKLQRTAGGVAPQSQSTQRNSIMPKRHGSTTNMVLGESMTRRSSTYMIKIAIILGSTRPGRNGEAVAKWVYEIAQKRSAAEFELADIKDFNLPLLDEPVPPIKGQYSKPHTKTGVAMIGSFDGYVLVAPESNH